MTVVTVSGVEPLRATTDAVLLAHFEGIGLDAAGASIDESLGGPIAEMRSTGELRGRFAELMVLPRRSDEGPRRVLVLGLGKREQLDAYRLHNAFWFAGQRLREHRLESVTLCIDAGWLKDADDVVRSAVTGVLLANETQAGHRKHDDTPEPLQRIELSGVDAAETLLSEAVVLADASNRVKHWVARPSNTLTPQLFAEQVTAACEGTGVEVDIVDESRLRSLGAGALLGVARGSQEPPVMIAARYDGGSPDGPVLGLVGKGITFDTGGISIKPALGMELMKTDMGGGASVVAAVIAIAALRIPCNVVAVVPATENMPSGAAYKPGDILDTLDGRTIEVINTDAEGRIVLADGLAFARSLGATHLVDVATLTGAVIVALGHVAAGLMGSDRGLLARIQEAAAAAGERFCELPLHPEYDVCLESDVADVKNLDGREAGSICGGVFLREFSGGLPWAHLDIAGTAWNDQASMTQVPKGPSGAPVRTLVHLARHFAKA